MARQKSNAPDTTDGSDATPAPETETPEAYTSAQELYEQPAKDAVGRDLGPFESPNTPNPSDSVSRDERFVEGTSTVLMRGDRPDSE